MYQKHSRNQLNPQQKQWNQQYRNMNRKLDQSQKSSFKFLAALTNLGFNGVNSDLLQKIANQYELIDNNIHKEETGITNKLNKIIGGVNDFKQNLKGFEHSQQYLVKIQKISTNVYEKVEATKNQMIDRYDELDQIGQRMERDVQMTDRKIQLILQGNYQEQLQPETKLKINKAKNNQNNENKNRNNEGKSAKVLAKQQEQINPSKKIQHLMQEKQTEVEQLDKKIREMGKNLGWSEQDHKDFTTIWNRCNTKNYFEIEEQLSSYFSYYTGQQIREHMNKNLAHKKLLQSKKSLILEYKEYKQEKKQIQLAKLQSQQYQKQLSQKRINQNIRKQQEQKQMKDKVDQWKRKKQDEKILKRERQIQEDNKKKRQEKQRINEDMQKRKKVLEEWKEDKGKQKQVKEKRKRPNSAISKEAMERIKEREEKMKQEQMQRLVNKKMEQEQLHKKAEKLKEQKFMKYAYVNSKLQEKTVAIKQKEREKFDGKQKKDAETFGGQLLLTGIRAVPGWRQGL